MTPRCSLLQKDAIGCGRSKGSIGQKHASPRSPSLQERGRLRHVHSWQPARYTTDEPAPGARRQPVEPVKFENSGPSPSGRPERLAVSAIQHDVAGARAARSAYTATPRAAVGAARISARPRRMKLISWNVNGFAPSEQGPPRLHGGQGADVFCVQETKIQEAITDEMRQPTATVRTDVAEKRATAAVATFARPSRAVATVARRSSTARGDRPHEFATFISSTSTFPKRDGPERLAHKLRSTTTSCGSPRPWRAQGVVICGDVNTLTPRRHRAAAGTSSAAFCPSSASGCRADRPRYHDTFASSPGSGHYTWWDSAPAPGPQYRLRIDYFSSPTSSRGGVKAAGIMPDVQGSDHSRSPLF